MAGHLPGVRDLRLHPNERPGDTGAQWNLGGDAVAEQRVRSSEQVHEKTVSFKDLATLVAVVLDRKDAIDRAGAGVCERTQAAATSAWPTDVARNLPPFTPTSEPEDSANLPATDAAKVDTHAKKRRRPSDDASSAAVQQSPRLEELARASGGLSAGLAHPSVAADSLGLAKRARWCQPGNNTWEAAGDRLPSKAWHQPVAQHANRVSSADQNPSLVASSTGPKSPAEMWRKSSSPRPSTDDFPMQCPIRKTQGKWVLNLDCSCNGGKKKLQAPVHATRAGAVVKFTCTHTHCRSNHGGVCPHFQMCPHCVTLRSINSLSNGECRAGKGCRRRGDAVGKAGKAGKATFSKAPAAVMEEPSVR